MRWEGSPTAGLVVEVLLLLGVVGELPFDPAVGGVWPLLSAAAFLVLSNRATPPALIIGFTTGLGVVWLDEPMRQILLFVLGFVPVVWLSSTARLIYAGVAIVTLLKGEYLAAFLPVLPVNHAGNFLFLLIVWIFLFLRTGLACRLSRWEAAVGSLVALPLIHTVVLLGQQDGALSGNFWASPMWRIAAAVAVSIPFGHLSAVVDHPVRFGWVFAGLSAGVVAGTALLLGLRIPVERVIFDDSHGPWERTDLPYTPGDWGRDTVYNYRLLFEAQERLGVTAERVGEGEDLGVHLKGVGSHTVLVLKTPMREYLPATKQTVRDWVRQGGFALVISDHTDLFGMTQRLNSLLPAESDAFDSTAVFDLTGGLTRPVTRGLDALLGASNPLGRPTLFQTGTSLLVQGPSGVSVLRYGLSYAEPADYTRPNHFGSLQPRPDLAYRNYTAEWFVPSSVHRGGWLLVGDSTPWSNFSFAMPGYLNWWKGILKIAEFRAAWIAVSWTTVCLAVLLVILAVLPLPSLQSLAAAAIGMILTVGVATHVGSLDAPDLSNVTWQQGNTAVVEFLEGMRPPRSLNYSHLFAALPRWGRIPRMSSIGHPPKDHREALLLHPGGVQFSPDEWADYVRSGGHLILIDDPRNSDLGESRRLLAAMDIRIDIDSRSALRAPELQTRSPTAWEKVFEVRPEPTRPTTVSVGHLGQWHRFEVGEGKLDVNLNGFGLSDLAVGDIWGGKLPGIYASEMHGNLAAILGAESLSPAAAVTTLPEMKYSPHIEYSIVFSNGRRETEVLDSSCTLPSLSRKTAELIWCDTSEWLAGNRSGPWQMVAVGHWRTEVPVRLANGQDYIGQIVAAGDNWTVAEWVHDGMWGDDATHRVILRAISE